MAIRRIDIAALQPAFDRQATLLAPNYRISDAILGAYTASAKEDVFRTPHVAAIDVWIKELWDCWAHSGILPFAQWQLLSPVEEKYIWTSVVEQSLARYPLLNPADTANAISQSYRDLRQWVPDKGLQRLQQVAASPDSAAFLQWIQDYQKVCHNQQRIALVDAIGMMLDLSDQDWQALPLLPDEIALVNFFDPPPLYQQLFAKLKISSTVTSHEVPQSDSESAYLAPAPSSPRTRIEFGDQEQEILACATWAQQLRTEHPDAHIGIVYAEDFLSKPPLRHLFNTTLDSQQPLATLQGDNNYNSSGSRQTLLESGIIHDAFLILNLTESTQSSQDLCRLLQSPYISRDEAEQESRLRMELFMRRNFSATTTISEFSRHLQREDRNYFAPQLAAALLALRSRTRQFPATASTRAWAQHFAELLTDLGWPGNACTAADLTLVDQWHTILRVFANAGNVVGAHDRYAALSRLRNLCAEQPQASRFRHDNPLSVYSVAEAVGLQFDYVWLLGFSTQHWPPASHPSPFIPYSLQRDVGIPGCHSDDIFASAQMQLSILQASVTQQVVASHHCSDGELEYRPSSFIIDWPLSETPVLPARDKSEPATLETVFDPATHELVPDESVQGGQRIISNQSSCPFRAFTLHRLRAEPLQPFEAGLSMRDRGSALHEALEWLYSEIDSLSTLQNLDKPARQSLVASASTVAIEFLSRRHSDLMTPRFRQLEQQRITLLLEQFLELETSRSDFTLVARELPLQWQYGNLKLNLKIDRVDKLNDHTLALIDYKTGKRATSSKSWLEARPEDMQLPLYYTVAAAQQQEQPITALAIAHVNIENMAYSGLVATNNLHDKVKPVTASGQTDKDWQSLTQDWQTNVEQRAAEFIAGEAQVAPIKGRSTCQYCGLESLCRIQELDTGITDDSDELANETDS